MLASLISSKLAVMQLGFWVTNIEGDSGEGNSGSVGITPRGREFAMAQTSAMNVDRISSVRGLEVVSSIASKIRLAIPIMRSQGPPK